MGLVGCVGVYKAVKCMDASMELGWEKVARRLDGIVQPDRQFLSAGRDSIEEIASDGIESSLSSLLKEKYHVVYHDSMETFVDKLNTESQKKKSRIQLQIHKTKWEQFNDKSDNIRIEGMTSTTYFKNKNILFVASFHDNAVTLSQFHVIAFLCECLAQSITVLLPFYSTGTMERVDIGDDGKIPTANTLALLFNGLPSVGRPIRVMTYDMHTLQNRFFFTGHAVATLHTAIPLIKKIIEVSKDTDKEINAIAFPDEGAHKDLEVCLRR
jgi:phosphoribosylpyrophosphate synthetase